MWAYAILAGASFAHPTSDISFLARSLTAASQPILPSQDSWYTAPANFSSAAPGAVLRVRPAPGNLTTVYNESLSAYHILYRTTDSRYQPSWAVTTLFAPKTPSDNSTGGALLSYQIPYNTADVDGSPSYALALPSGLATGLVLSDINTALSYGWYVTVPDFEGPSASFSSGVSEGHATLDSIRAVLSSGHAPSKARSAMWGYSGGSIASEWAAELQVQYAPELTFSGVALGGLPPNVTSIVLAIDGTPAAGLIPSFLVGMTRQYPEAYAYLVSSLKISGPYNATGFLAVRNMTYTQAAVSFMNQSIISNYFTNGTSFLQSPIIRKVFNNNAYMGYHGVPQMPMFVYKAVHDEYSLVEETDALVDKYCAIGASITYQRNTAGNHLDEYINGDAGALKWLKGVLGGKVAQQGGCTTQNVTITISVEPPFYLPPP